MGGNRINFLDTTIIKNNNKLIFDWYYKPTYLGRFEFPFPAPSLPEERYDYWAGR